MCRLHIAVSSEGRISDLQVAQSTGFAAPDAACKDAIYHSQFVPAHLNNAAVGGETDVVIDWRLPASVGRAQ
ncbi:MAG: hypothetical protein ACLQO1_22920 [Steroidobacteraceae bacterium]